MEIIVKICVARVFDSVLSFVCKSYQRDTHTRSSALCFHGFNQCLAGVSLSFILASGLVPVVPVHDQAFAANITGSTAVSAQNSEDEVIIVYEDDSLELNESINPNARSAETTLQDVGIIDQEEIESTTDNRGAVSLAQLSEDASMEEAIQKLEESPSIAYVQPNYSYSLLATTTSDPYCVPDAEGSNLDNQQYLFDTKIVDAWDYAKTEGSVTVAVLDTGCNLNHVDLQGTLDVEHAYDVTSGLLLSQSGVANGGDANGHGTLVSGVIAARADNGQGIAGSSYNANILPVKVFDEENTCTSADLIAAYAYLNDLIEIGSLTDLRVINISMGYYSDRGDQTDEALHESIANMLNEHDVLTVCAGGNGDASGQAITAACYPSDFDECLSVTALDEDGSNATFSDYNAAKDISAPGVNILSTNVDGGYSAATGSSMSAPIVSGSAALLWSVDSSLTASQIVDVLKSAAVDVTGNAHMESGSAGALDVRVAIAQVLGIDQKDSEQSSELGEDDPELADNANENAVMGPGGDSADEPNGSDRETNAGSPGENSEGSSTNKTGEGTENSWRYQNGELLPGIAGSGSSSTNILPFGADSAWEKNGSTWSTMYGGSRMTVTNAIAFGIDVSEHNGNINWAKAKAAGVEFAIIRCGYGMNQSNQDDKYFFQNVRGCLDNDIPFGIYLYSYADSTSRASSEADHVLRLLSEAGLSRAKVAYPIYYDLEEKSLEKTSNRALLANMASTFCNKISNAGYAVGIYANKNWFDNYLTDPVFNKWTKWVAQYPYSGTLNAKCSYSGTHDMWQCMSSGKVNGINTAVDINFDYRWYPPKLISDGKGLRYRNPDGSFATGWRTVSGKTYYFGSDTYALKWEQTIDGKFYYFDTDYSMRTGWVTWNKDGTRTYFGSDGAALSGWQTIGGKRYYFDPAKQYHGARWETTIDGKFYYFDTDCSMYTGLITWNRDGSKSFFGSNGVMASGWQSWRGKRYYISPSTMRAVKWEQTIDGKSYYFDTDCSMHVGWLRWNSDGKYSYFESNGVQCYGSKRINGIYYNFGSGGRVSVNWDRANMASTAQGYSSNTNYLILVNTTIHKVSIYQGERGNWTEVKYWTCTNGAPRTPTVKGTFIVQNRGKSFGSGYTCWYWTQFYGNYLFHSVLYNPGSMSSIQDGRLGIAASHGCVRLDIANAKWIYDVIPWGTKVVVY